MSRTEDPARNQKWHFVPPMPQTQKEASLITTTTLAPLCLMYAGQKHPGISRSYVPLNHSIPQCHLCFCQIPLSKKRGARVEQEGEVGCVANIGLEAKMMAMCLSMMVVQWATYWLFQTFLSQLQTVASCIDSQHLISTAANSACFLHPWLFSTTVGCLFFAFDWVVLKYWLSQEESGCVRQSTLAGPILVFSLSCQFCKPHSSI